MKLKLASILVLAALLGLSTPAKAPAAPAVPAFYMEIEEDGIPTVKQVREDEDMCKNMGIKNVTQWLQEGKVCLEKQDPGIGKDYGIKELQVLVQYYSGLHNQELHPDKVDHAGLAKLGQKVTAGNIETLITHAGEEGKVPLSDSHPMGYLMRHVNEDVIRGIDSTTFVALLQGVTKDFPPVAGKDYNAENLIWLLNVFGESETITGNVEVIVNALSEHNVPTKRLNDGVLKALMANPEECEKMTHSDFFDTMSPHQISMLSPECLDKIDNLDKVKCGIDVRALSPDTIKKTNKALHKTCFKLMNTEQVANYAVELGEDSETAPCENFKLGEGLIGNGSKMRPECFQNALESAAVKGSFQLGDLWPHVPENVLKGISEERIPLVGAENAKYMSAEQKQPLFDNPEHCDKVQDGMLKYLSKGVRISDECFTNLSIENKKDALIHAKVNDTVLAKTDSVELGKIGVDIFEQMSSVSNLAAIIEKMGSGVEDNHPCRQFRDKNVLLSSVVRYYMSEGCLKALGKVTWEVGDLEHMSKHLASMLDMKMIVQAISAGDIAGLGLDTFTKLQKKLHICKYLTLDQVKAIASPGGFINSLPAGCLSEMDEEVLKGLTKTELGRVPAEAFTGVNPDHIGKGILNADQAAKLSG